MKIFTNAWRNMMRREVRLNADCVADVYLSPDSIGSDGALIDAPVLVRSGVPCSVNKWGTIATESMFGGKSQEALKWVVTMDADQMDISARHELEVIGSIDGVRWSRRLKVINQLEPSSTTAMIRVLCNG